MSTPFVSLGNYFDKQPMIDLFNDNRSSRLQKFGAATGNLPSDLSLTWDEMYFSADEANLFRSLPLTPRGFQFSLSQPNFNYSIHKDSPAVGSKVGTLLFGAGDIVFYDESDVETHRHDWSTDIVKNAQYKHAATAGSDGERLTLWVNFSEDYETVKAAFGV